jgi:hypothetical protein
MSPSSIKEILKLPTFIPFPVESFKNRQRLIVLWVGAV